MQSIYWTGRLLSRALWNGIASYSTSCSSEQQPNAVVASSSRRREASLISAVCGFPKELSRSRIRKGQFGDDAWFTAKFKTAEVIGEERETWCIWRLHPLWFTIKICLFFVFSLYFPWPEPLSWCLIYLDVFSFKSGVSISNTKNVTLLRGSSKSILHSTSFYTFV